MMMRCLISTTTLVAAAASVSAGTLSIPISQEPVDHHVVHRRLVSRGDSLEIAALNNLNMYVAEIQVGTPGQKIQIHLDTGSSDLWVNSVNADMCLDNDPAVTNCTETFDPKRSSTFKDDADSFNIGYLDGRKVNGLYFKDTVRMNGATIKSQRMGLGMETMIGTGIMGLGMKSQLSSSKPYPTVIDNLVSQGIIKTHAFSLYLNSVTAKAGNILFGGVDASKFYDQLALIPMIVNTGTGATTISSYSVQLDRVTAKGIDNIPGQNISVILDSGSTLSALPTKTVAPIHARLDVRTDPRIKASAFIDCAGSKTARDFRLEFHFNQKTIYVPMQDLIIDRVPDEAQAYMRKILNVKWDKACFFGLVSLEDLVENPNREYNILGDTFLRAAYVVYDLDNKMIGIAQAKFNVRDSQITAFVQNGTIPHAQDPKTPPSITSGGTDPNGKDQGSMNDNNQKGIANSLASSYLTVGFFATATLLLINIL